MAGVQCPISVLPTPGLAWSPRLSRVPPSLLETPVPTSLGRVPVGTRSPPPRPGFAPFWAGGREGLTLGLLPPMAPGRMEPVSWYLQRILETQPWDTRSWREMTQGLMPWWAISTILCRIWLGKGLPLINTPPS